MGVSLYLGLMQLEHNLSTWIIFPMLASLVEFHADTADVGQIGLYCGLLACAFPSGLLCAFLWFPVARDMLRPEVLLPCTLIGTALASVWFAFSSSFLSLVSARFMWGFSSCRVDFIECYCRFSEGSAGRWGADSGATVRSSTTYHATALLGSVLACIALGLYHSKEPGAQNVRNSRTPSLFVAVVIPVLCVILAYPLYRLLPVRSSNILHDGHRASNSMTGSNTVYRQLMVGCDDDDNLHSTDRSLEEVSNHEKSGGRHGRAGDSSFDKDMEAEEERGQEQQQQRQQYPVRSPRRTVSFSAEVSVKVIGSPEVQAGHLKVLENEEPIAYERSVSSGSCSSSSGGGGGGGGGYDPSFLSPLPASSREVETPSRVEKNCDDDGDHVDDREGDEEETDDDIPGTHSKLVDKRCYSTGAEDGPGPSALLGEYGFQEWWECTRARLTRTPGLQIAVMILSVVALLESAVLTVFGIWAHSVGWSYGGIIGAYAFASVAQFWVTLAPPQRFSPSHGAVAATQQSLWALQYACVALFMQCFLVNDWSNDFAKGFVACGFAGVVGLRGSSSRCTWILVGNACYSFEHRVAGGLAHSVEVIATLVGAYLTPSIFALTSRVDADDTGGVSLSVVCVFLPLVLLVRASIAAAAKLGRGMNRRRREPSSPRYSRVVEIATSMHEIDIHQV